MKFTVRISDRAAEQPLMFGMIHRHVPRALTRRFPYAIYFVIDDDRVTILRVLHQARKPSAWKR